MAIIFIGKEFKYRNFIQTQIFSKYKTDEIYYFDNVEFEIESILGQHKEVLVVSNEKLYSTIAKIIATLNDDILELKNGYLVPTNTILFDKNSFLISHNDTLINLIKITDFIPNILLKKEIFTLHIFNYDLMMVQTFIKPIFETFQIDYTIYQNEGRWCEVKFEKFNESLIKQLKGFIPHIIFEDNIFKYLKNKLSQLNKKITFAESCTGGLIASNLTKIAGSSEVFDGSVVSYANKIKSKWLNVSENVLENFGAVSKECVEEMLEGVLKLTQSDYAIAVSGIAGPEGGSDIKPVGTVYIGVANKENKYIERIIFKGSRQEVQYQAMLYSIGLLIRKFELY